MRRAAEARLEEALAQLEREQGRQKEINQTVNQPSFEKPEWDKGKPPHRDRAEAGNRAKREPDARNKNPLLECPECGTE